MESDRALVKGLILTASGVIFFAYALLKDTHVLPVEIIKLFGTCTGILGVYFICSSFYLRSLFRAKEANNWQNGSQVFTRSNKQYFNSYSGPANQPSNRSLNSTVNGNVTRNNIYAPKSEEMAEAFLRAQNSNYNQEVRYNPSSSYQFGNALGGPRVNAGSNNMILNPVHNTQYTEPDHGIHCNRDSFDKPFSKVALFNDLPMNREASSGTNKLFPNSFTDDYTSRRESAMRTQHRQSTSIHRNPWATDRTYIGSNRSASPMYRAESQGYASVRPLMKKSTVMMKETTSIYSNIDKKTMLNQGNYSKAMEALAAIGGDEVAFNQSLKSLHNWVSHKLLEKYYEENRVC